MEDPSNPFFLHHSDGPGIALVSQPLTDSNYNTWNRAMIVALSVKNKLGFVDGSIPRPPDGDPQLSAWLRCNNVVISWLYNSVSALSTDVVFEEEGATNHICFSKQSFHDLTTIKNSFVTLPNGSRIPIEGIGQAFFSDDWQG
ncbi:Gag-polypeptide of LTR copia-type [Sesbania bispinosa]|nr:Gag-polypeptide of LTR copia-type [Sesbania bispinosa]